MDKLTRRGAMKIMATALATVGILSSAAAGSALTCFGVNGTDGRVYYRSGDGHVPELAWVGNWVATDLTAWAGAPLAASGSALTCFGVNGSASRVYYLSGNGHVHELAWVGNWVATDLTALAGAPPAAAG